MTTDQELAAIFQCIHQNSREQTTVLYGALEKDEKRARMKELVAEQARLYTKQDALRAATRAALGERVRR